MFTYNAIVTNVVDGDTIDVLADLGFSILSKQRIRLAEIDTPERGQEGFTEATVKLSEMIMGKEIQLMTKKQSKYGYYLGHIFISGIDVNKEMLDSGLAKPYTGGKK